MITSRTFTKDWLVAINRKLGWNRQETQLKNLEKAVTALHLLELLSDAKLHFIFKGGTSLILLLKKIYRLSVDIDIIVEEPISEPESVFTNICNKSCLFTHYEQDERDRGAAEDIKHYKFFYQPFVDATENSYILLDLYRALNPYSKTLELELASDILNTEGENVSVRVPDIDSILGDKLTAFAPDTIGIPLSAEPGHRPKRVEVIKQLFDVGNLFDMAEDVDSISFSFNTIARQEIERHGLEIKVEDALQDCARHAYIIGHGGRVDKAIYDSIAKGFKDFNKFVSDLSFDERLAVLAAAKIAYLVSVLLAGGKTLEKYSDEIDMKDWLIQDSSLLDFNEYLFNNPEAFFYWFKAEMTRKST